jgi:hypothetical protein
MMLDCLVMGDSLAVGTHLFKPECVSYSQTGITSLGWNKKFGNKNLLADTVVISLGSNDLAKADTYGMLMLIRSKVDSTNVYWIEPNIESKPDAAQQVRIVAKQFGDTVLVNKQWSPDKTHPTMNGYKELAQSARK